MDRQKLLVVCPLITLNAPQPARFRELAGRWVTHFDVTVLAFDTGRPSPFGDSGARYTTIGFTAAGRVLIASRLDAGSKGVEETKEKRARRVRPARSLLKKLRINRFFFPDIFIVEYLNLRKSLFRLVRSLRPDTVIFSTAPFTLMLLVRPLRRAYPEIKTVIDTGDPFYGDSSPYAGRVMHRLFAHRVEKVALTATDMLVVPTRILMKHYLSSFSDVIIPERISVIENGINELFTGMPPVVREPGKPFTAVYAGRFYRRLREPAGLYNAITMFPGGSIILKIFGNIQDEHRPPRGDSRFFCGEAVPAGELAGEYEKADVIIYLDNACGVQVPGKIYEVLAVNRPILYICKDENSPSYELVKDEKGVVVVYNNSHDIAAGLSRVMAFGPGMDFDRDSGRYTFSALAARYISVLESLGAGR